ncbi:MAG: DNA translocase FtsK 4TM domain-containing protein [Nibricoccus sp.]
MAKSASSNSNNSSSFQAPRYQPRWAVFSLCLLFGLLLSVAFISYDPAQSPEFTTHPTAKNPVGTFGVFSAYWSLHYVGIATWLIPLFLLWMAYVAIRNSRRLAGTRVLAMLICIVCVTGLAAMWDNNSASDYFSGGLGGIIGGLIYQSLLRDTLGVFGTGLLLVMIYALGLMFIFTKDISAEFEKFTHGFSAWRESRAKIRAERAEVKRMAKEAMSRPKTAPVVVGPPPAKKLSIASRSGSTAPMGTRPPFAPEEKPEGFADAPAKRSAATKKADADAPPEPATKQAALPAPAASKSGKGTVSPFADNAPLATDTKALAVNAGGRIELNIVKPEEPKKAAKATVPQSLDENYQFPRSPSCGSR